MEKLNRTGRQAFFTIRRNQSASAVAPSDGALVDRMADKPDFTDDTDKRVESPKSVLICVNLWPKFPVLRLLRFFAAIPFSTGLIHFAMFHP